MKEIIIEAAFKLKNTEILVPIVHLYYDMHLIKKVYFGCRVLYLLEQQECVLKKIYWPVILWKLKLSKNFSRSVLHTRKTALGAGVLSPETIVHALAMKLHFSHKQAIDWVRKAIQVNKDNA